MVLYTQGCQSIFGAIKSNKIRGGARQKIKRCWHSKKQIKIITICKAVIKIHESNVTVRKAANISDGQCRTIGHWYEKLQLNTQNEEFEEEIRQYYKGKSFWKIDYFEKSGCSSRLSWEVV